MRSFLEVLAIFLASVNLLMTRFALAGLHQPTTVPLWLIKVFTSAISPLLFLLGLLTIAAGVSFNSIMLIVMGSCAAIFYLIHMISVTRPPHPSVGLQKTVDVQGNNIPPERKASFLSKRYVLRLPNSPEPIVDHDVTFYTIPGANRHLLCDIWQPRKDISHSGLGFIYLHGSAWTALDKDYGTRPFFRHLVSQGHVIMDVAYRLFPETDFMGMIYDAKHAIAWIKTNAKSLGISPDRIVIGGGSAGAHIALMAAYTSMNNQFTPIDLHLADLTVRGVISLYGQADLKATYFHTCQHLTTRSALSKREKDKSGGMPSWMQKRMGKDYHRLGFDKNAEPGMLAPMLGGGPDEKPEIYSQFSPITHVHRDCPPTLLIHGKQDILAPIEAIQHLYSQLIEAGVPVKIHLLPQTDHAFDLILPKISPSAQNAFYETERFLSSMV